MSEELIYFDHAAATPVDPVVFEAMRPYFSENFFNPSSPYAPAVEVRRDYQEAKGRIARELGVLADELVMTAGATESVNLAFSAASGEVAVAAIEHAAVLEAGRPSKQIKIMPDKKGRITPEAVSKALTPEVGFLSVGLANGELGTVQPIAEIARVVEVERQRRREAGEVRPLIFHSDASQGLNLLDIKIKRLGVDLLTLSAAKIYGPKQVGLLWARPGVKMRPDIAGGGQELGLRSGTENVAGVIGFAIAMELAAKRRKTEVERLRGLRDDLQERLADEFPEIIINSDSKKGLVSFLNVSFPGLDAERLIYLLEARGVMLATGSACAANKGQRSHVLEAIGLDEAAINGSLRISLGRLSGEENVKKGAELIIEAVKLEKQRLGQ